MYKDDFLDFEKPIAELEAKIQELKNTTLENSIDILDDLSTLQEKSIKLTQNIFKSLTDHQIMQLARHSLRPHSIDYIEKIFDDFTELSGDRRYARGQAIITGIARLERKSVMVIAQEKGRETEDKIKRNFGMPKPECYRQAKRIMLLAEKFKLPIISFVDTAGAYPGIDAEKTNQSEAIARNIFIMSKLKTPILSVIIGEGGSGGALAISVADKIMMLQYSIFSVISPEGCASILWKDSAKAKEAAASMNITAEKLYKLGLIDRIIDEPLGGAHRDIDCISDNIKSALVEELNSLSKKDLDQLISDRYTKYRSIKTKE